MFALVLLYCARCDWLTSSTNQGPVVRKPANANPGLKFNQGSYTPYSKMAENTLFFCLHVNWPLLPRFKGVMSRGFCYFRSILC